MIAEIYYYTSCEADVKENGLKVGEEVDLVVPVKGKLLHSLSLEDNILFHVLTTPNSIVEPIDNNTISIKNVYIQSFQALSPSVIENIIEIDKEDVYARHGFILDWAIEHCFRSVIIFYLSKYPTLRKYIDRLIYDNLTKTDRTWTLIQIIKRYEYDVHKNNDALFKQAAMCKNIKMCEILLNEKGCLIPANIFKIYKTHGSKHYPLMWEFLKENADKVDWR